MLSQGLARKEKKPYSRQVKTMKKRILYGEANYPALVRENGYFVDKTAYIQKLELMEKM